MKSKTLHMIGNAHIDPVWLWGWQAGVDEALATLSTAADLCDAYPEFIFTRGEAWLYQQVDRLRQRQGLDILYVAKILGVSRTS